MRTDRDVTGIGDRAVLGISDIQAERSNPRPRATREGTSKPASPITISKNDCSAGSLLRRTLAEPHGLAYGIRREWSSCPGLSLIAQPSSMWQLHSPPLHLGTLTTIGRMRRDVSTQRHEAQPLDLALVTQIEIRTSGQGMFEFTDRIQDAVSGAGVREGLCTLMIQHTSASLTIQENADPSARRDLEDWLNRLVPEGDSHFTHTQEGPDDMPSHVKAALTATTLSIPILDGQLALGTWQGVFLWEHRQGGSTRRCVVHVGE